MTRQNLPELRLMAYATKSDGYLTVRVHIVEINDRGEVENVRNYPSEPRYGLVDLGVSAQANRNDNDDFYAWDLTYQDIYRVNLRELEPKVKTLRELVRKMDKLEQTLGRPTDFVTYVGRLAHVLGAAYIGRTAEGARSYREGVHWMNVDGFRSWVTSIREDFQP